MLTLTDLLLLSPQGAQSANTLWSLLNPNVSERADSAALPCLPGRVRDEQITYWSNFGS